MTPSVCSTSYDAYSAPEATLQACGDKAYPLTSVTTTGDGGHAYHYKMDGMEAITRVPPSSFQPAHASTSELSMYGLKEPPANSPRHARWEYIINHIHFDTGPPAPRLIIVPNEENYNIGPAGNIGSEAGTASSENWSGYLNYSSYQQYTAATAIYPEPNPSATCTKASEVTWAGLGGYNSHNLAQDGSAYAAPGLGNHQAWWEILPAGYVGVPGYYATTGDYFEAETYYIDSKKVEFWFYNSANNKSYGVEVITSSGLDRSTADFIVERPRVKGYYVPLADFGSQEIDGYTEYTQLSKYPSNVLSMYSKSTLLASPGALGASFIDSWYNCGKEEE
jgi:hypothetical protein